MDEFLKRLWNKSNTPYTRAIGLFLIVLFAELGLVSTVSGIGYTTEVEKYRDSIGIVSVAIALFIAFVWLVIDIRKPKRLIFLKDVQNGKIYLKDLHGKAREIPDNDTLAYLKESLGATDVVLDVFSNEIDKIKGEKLVSPKKWKRPLTLEEQSAKELRYKVGDELEKVDVVFSYNTSPQKIVIHIANRGKALIHIQNVKFQPHRLSQESFPASYKKIDTSYIGIPFPENTRNLESGHTIQVEMELRQKWQRADIEKIRGELGFLLFDVIYEGKNVDDILISI